VAVDVTDVLAAVSVREIMAEDVLTAGPDVSVRDAARTMTDADVGSLVICEDDRPVGIFTQSDVTALVAAGDDPDDASVRGRMSSSPVTIDPDASVEEAAERMAEAELQRLPVVEDGTLVGIVGVIDVSYYLPRLAIGTPPGRRVAASRPEMAYEAEGWSAEITTEAEPTVGDVVSFTKPLDDEDVRRFAELSGDTNRLHLDDEFAAGTRFGQRIVHGTLVAGLVSAALARIPGLTIYLSQDLSFLGPVPIGSAVTAVCEISEDLGGDRYRLSTEVVRGDERVIEGEATVLIDDVADALPLEREAVER